VGISIDVSEVRALGSRLQTAGGRVGSLASTALRKTAYDIEADAKILAPVDTGNLRNSISTTISGDGRFGTMTAEIGPTAEYGIYQEFGTSTQPGTPFMGPAFDRRVPGYTSALADIAAREAL
jgi:HK97 gp10 family phage protein